MRRLTIGIGFALALLSTMPAEAYERPFAWTGLYVGVNGGYSWGRATAEVEVSTVGGSVVSESRSGDVSGWLGGGQIGYNWRSQRWVYGVEADFQWTGHDGDVSACSGPACATASYDLDWFGTLRGRVGYLLEPRALLYLTGGLAYGHLSADFSASAPPLGPVSISDSATRAGWVIGGGLEWALSGNWMLRAEYLYMALGTMQTKLGSLSPQVPFTIDAVILPTATATVRTDFTDQIFRVGVSYKFGESYAPLK